MLSALSKKLSLSPRPLRRQKATEGSISKNALLSPYNTPTSSPQWLRRSFPPPNSDGGGGAPSSGGDDSEPQASTSVPTGSCIQIVVDPSSPEAVRKTLTRQACSEPINSGLLGVHLTPSMEGSDRRNPISAKSLPTSPVTSPGCHRKHGGVVGGGWKSLARPRLRKAASDRGSRPRSANFTLLRTKRVCSLDCELMDDDIEYCVIGAGRLMVEAEIEVRYCVCALCGGGGE